MGKNTRRGTKKPAAARRAARPASQVEAKPSKRRCGACTACCHAMRIEELDKPEWSPCSHMRSGDPASESDAASHARGGCSIYRERPVSCRAFTCLWLDGLTNTREEHRPDRCGVMLAPTDNPRVVQAREVWPGAAEQPEGRALVTLLRTMGLRVAVVAPGRTTEFQPLTIFGVAAA